MEIKEGIILLIGVVCIFVFFWWRMRKGNVQVVAEEQEKEPVKKVKQKFVRVTVQSNEKQQIHICCYNMQEKIMGEMLASYTLKSIQEQALVVHLENILVSRRFRRMGVGRILFSYLLKEMERIEKKENCSFRYIYGEIGQGGTDDPNISVPFYKAMDKTVYGEEKMLRYQQKKGMGAGGEDMFYYYISSR